MPRSKHPNTLNDVVDRLCETINLLTENMVKSITNRDWLKSMI